MNESQDKKKKTKKEIAWKAFKTFVKAGIITGLVLVCVAGGLLIGVVAGCIFTTDTLQEEDLYITGFVSYIKDTDGNTITTLKGSENKNRIWVDYEEVPQDLFDAMVSIEDERFYQHNGVDFKRTLAAFFGYFLPGFSNHGGSTITQQVVKNITGDDARSIPRKIREQWRSIQLEKDYDKNEILELYVNVIYMGSDLYGVKTAAKAYFEKDLQDLNLAECAFLAGITNNPGRYNPLTITGRSNAYKRQITILDKMRELGYISDVEYIEAIQTDLVFNDDYRREQVDATKYSYFAETVIRDLRADLQNAGYSETQANNIIYNQGVTIISTQNSAIQQIVDEEFCRESNFPANKNVSAIDNPGQASIVITDPYTGHIIALYGGYGEKTSSFGFNRATQAARSPGSSIKPILLYGPLIDMHVITPDSLIVDEEVFLNPQEPDVAWPKNSDNIYHGTVTVRQALKRSYNVPAVLWYKDYITECLGYLKNMGIDRSKETQLSAVLGGFSQGVSAREMAGAYSPFVTNGVYNPAITYTEVYDRNGELFFTNPAASVQVYQDSNTPKTMTSMLRDVVTGGTAAGYINVKNQSGESILAAGKTGTTSNTYDVWFVGYTPYYVGAVWYGYDNNKIQITSANAESKTALRLWNVVMNRVHASLASVEFTHTGQSPVSPATPAPTPETVKEKVIICSDSGMVAGPNCPNTREQSFVSGTQPKKVCTFHTDSEIPSTPTPAPETPVITPSPTPEITPDPSPAPDTSAPTETPGVTETPEPSSTPETEAA